MALGDQTGLKAVELLNSKTLPELKALGLELLGNLEQLAERLDGATITITIKLPDKVIKNDN